MPTEKTINFDIQKLTVGNDSWTVELWYERKYAENKVIEAKNYSKTIDLSDIGGFGSVLAIKTANHLGNTNSCLITGIDGGSYLHTSDDKDKSQSVKLIDDNLILSLGFTFFSFDIGKQEIEWKLQDDYLLRGELEIHRIDRNGNIKWSYAGKDIWVNIEGKQEVSIENDKIILTDFNSHVYEVDFNGQTLADRPLLKVTMGRKKWWKLWKQRKTTANKIRPNRESRTATTSTNQPL